MAAQQRDGARPGVFRVDSPLAVRCRAGRAATDLQIELEPIALRTRLHSLQHVDAAGELQRRLH